MMLTTKRKAQLKQPDGTFKDISFHDLKKGDEFILFEEDGEPVDKGKVLKALSDASPPTAPFPTSADFPRGVWSIQVDEYIHQLEADPL